MRAVLKNEFYRAFYNKLFLAVILAETIYVVVYTVAVVFPDAFKSLPFMLSLLSSGKTPPYLNGPITEWIAMHRCSYNIIIFPVLPILAAIPYGSSLYTDEKNRYVYNIQLRCKKEHYYWSKLITLFFSGGVIGVYPFLLSFLINLALMPFDIVQKGGGGYAVSNLNLYSELFYEKPAIYIVIFLLHILIIFGIMNCFCFIGSYLFSNKFVVMIFPFAIFFVLYVLGNFIGHRVNPWLYCKLNYTYKSSFWEMVIQLCIFLFINVVICVYKSSRKVDSL